MNTHGVTMPNGRHKGELLTRVPVQYLKWMVCARHTMANLAAAELERRGTVTPDLDISGHAIDRASLRCRVIWHKTRGKEEGLHAWLCRVAMEAWKSGPGSALSASDLEDSKGHKVHHMGMIFCFEVSGIWPVLKTVMRDEKVKS